MMRFDSVWLLALALAACDPGSAPRETPRCADGPSADERAQNQAIFDGLEPTCAGCHITGARGYFASIEAFESLVAYNPDVVIPGDPDGSELVRLLEGNGSGPFAQMPTAGPTYAQLASDGTAELGMDEIRGWVGGLGDHAPDPNPSSAARRITRLGASDIQRALYQQLGLSDQDFFVPASNYDVPHKSSQNDGNYPLTSPEAYPAPFEQLPVDRFMSLGGGSAMFQYKTDGSVSPSFAGSLGQISQRWCAMAIDKAGNAALFGTGGSAMTGSAQPDAVKAVLEAWFLHFHAVEAQPDEIDRVYGELFVPLESEADTRTAWVGTCSWFIRHPDWVFY